MDYTKYLNPIEYPKKPYRPVHPKAEASAQDHRTYADRLDQYEVEMVKYNADKDLWQNNENIRYDKFKKDAMEEAELVGHPAADRAWTLAWDKGYSAGFSEVMSNLYQIAEVVLGDKYQVTHTSNTLRDKLLTRIGSIRTIHGGFKENTMRWKLVSFGKTKVAGNKKNADSYVDTHISNVDFAALDDDKLIEVFEIIIRRMNVQM